MRQVTGSNPSQAQKKVSIQVKLGGRSFSADNLNIPKGTKHIEFIIDTPRVTLVPRKELSLETASEFLRIVGKPCRINEQCVCSETQGDMVAVIAIDAEALATITKEWGSRATFSTPLLDINHSDEECLTIKEGENVTYVHLFDNGLQRAEAIEISSEEDILYIATKWFGERIIPIYIKGSNKAAKLLRKYYKQVICE